MEQLSEIIITNLHNSSKDGRYLVVSNDNFMEANKVTAELLTTMQKSDTMDEGIEKFLQNHNSEGFTSEQIKSLLEIRIMPLLMKEQKQKKQFLYQRQLLDREQIENISSKLFMLFNKYIMCGVLLATVVLDIMFFVTTANLLEFSNKINAYTIFALVAFIIASSMFHEFGHAAACQRFGVRHGGIGFGLYINFPVLYTDVTNVWQLPRRQRLVVNIAGVYFQSMILTLLLVAFLLTGDDMVRYMILTMNFGFLLTLNPFFKFDGYWIATDVLGMPNLRKRSTELLKYVFRRLMRRPTGAIPYLMQIQRREQLFVVIYALAVNLFMGYYFLYIIPVFLYDFVGNFPQELHQLVLCMSNNIMPPFALLRNMFSQTVFFGLILFMLYRIMYPMLLKQQRQS